jgi:hypothetical protein
MLGSRLPGGVFKTARSSSLAPDGVTVERPADESARTPEGSSCRPVDQITSNEGRQGRHVVASLRPWLPGFGFWGSVPQLPRGRCSASSTAPRSTIRTTPTRCPYGPASMTTHHQRWPINAPPSCLVASGKRLRTTPHSEFAAARSPYRVGEARSDRETDP